jgi:hypothetical protein
MGTNAASIGERPPLEIILWPSIEPTIFGAITVDKLTKAEQASAGSWRAQFFSDSSDALYSSVVGCGGNTSSNLEQGASMNNAALTSLPQHASSQGSEK